MHELPLFPVMVWAAMPRRAGLSLSGRRYGTNPQARRISKEALDDATRIAVSDQLDAGVDIDRWRTAPSAFRL